jgi:hypothetical protein
MPERSRCTEQSAINEPTNGLLRDTEKLCGLFDAEGEPERGRTAVRADRATILETLTVWLFGCRIKRLGRPFIDM